MGALVRVTDQLVSFEVLDGQIFCGFDATTREGKVRMYRASQRCVHRLVDFVGKVIDLETFAVHRRDYNDPETGEVRFAIRCVLWGKDGATYSTVSDVVRHNLAGLVGIFGAPPWEPAVRVKPREQKARSGRTYLDLDLVDQDGDNLINPDDDIP